MISLGIETSCDETSVSLLRESTVLSSSTYSQVKEHRKFGGVVPEIASRSHVEKIAYVLTDALNMAKVGLGDVDLVCSTAGPGLIGALAVGFSFGKGLALSLSKPFMGVHHIEAHFLANYLKKSGLEGAQKLFSEPRPPFVVLVISGGHTELIEVKSDFTYELLAKTRDDASGEAFDKTGKLLGLGYPAGPEMSRLASRGDPTFLKLPIPMKDHDDFSFSGLKTAVYYQLRNHSQEWKESNMYSICASVQEAIVDTLLHKSMRVLKRLKQKQFLLAGGVACNLRLREKLGAKAAEAGVKWWAPSPEFCTDNGAMIAYAGWFNYTRYGLKMSRNGIFPSGPWYSA